MKENESPNTNNLTEKTMSRRKLLSTAAGIGAGALLESQIGLATKLTNGASAYIQRGADRMLDKPEREVAHEEVLPILFEEVIKKLATAEGQTLLNVSADDEEWTFARNWIENDTGERGPYGEGMFGYGISDSEDGLTERIYYTQMLSVKDAVEVWAVREKQDGRVIERGLNFSLPNDISNEEDAVDALEKYLTVPDEAIGNSMTDLKWYNRSDVGLSRLENYELRGWDSENIKHTIRTFGSYMSYTTESRDSL